MAKSSPSGDRGPLEQLRGSEAELERSLGEARRRAAGVVAAARGEAERIVAEARSELAQELARLRAEAEAIARAEADAAGSSALEASAALARRAEENRPRALALLLEVVLGRGAP